MRQDGSRKLWSDFSLGGAAAESDTLLLEAFHETGQYRRLVSRDDRSCFLVGRTGSGKSAAFQRIEEQYRGHVIRINPENLSLGYINDLGVVRYLTELDVRLDPFFNALWKHVLMIEIIKSRYKVYSPAAKANFFENLKNSLMRDKSKQAALQYLNDFESKFWNETDERVREITHTLERQIEAEATGKLGLRPAEISLGGKGSRTWTSSERAEIGTRFQRIINETQVPRLNQMIDIMDQNILNDPLNRMFILIDDLDRDWADEKIVNMLIRNLFQVVVNLQQVRNLKVLVALRTNIFESLDFGKAGGQEEKFRSLTQLMTWDRTTLTELLDQRVSVAARHHRVSGVTGLDDLLPRANKTRGSALDFILERTLLRPRDAITFINECLRLNIGKDRLTWDQIHAAEISYSNSRLLALRDEWKPTYPGIDEVLRKFMGAPAQMSRDELTSCLDECILLIADGGFVGVTWMTDLGAPVWEGAGDWAESYQPIFRLLYNVGFLGCIKKSGQPAIYSHIQPDFSDRLNNLREVELFAVHPAFRPALDIAD